MKKTISKGGAMVSYFICLALIVALIVGNLYAAKYQQLISVYFDQPTTKVVQGEGESEYFTSAYSSEEEREKANQEMATNIAREGTVLLKNNNKTLPLASGSKISVFGQDAVDPIYGGAGAGSIDVSKAISVKASLEQAGFELNTTLWNFYENGPGKEYRKAVPDVYGQGAFTVNEVPVSAYTEEVKESFAEYNDAAIIMIGRSGSESGDIAREQLDSGYTYLQLDQDEKAMIQLAAENFDKVILILNTMNAMELPEVDAQEVDACLWAGAFGETGAIALGEILSGIVNPSGALVDSYAYDSFSAPSIENIGDYTITNSTIDRGNKYMVYGEGIYIGYLYYETRYEDVVLGNETKENFDYNSLIQFPFGYGLSYTQFAWSDYQMKEKGEEFEFTLKVTNTGEYEGKDVVQIYMQSPYTEYDRENKIEKASVKLAGYEKTGVIKPGESETVTISVKKEAMKVYDAKGAGTYVVDAGDYFFTAGNNSHEAINNILSAKGYTTQQGMDAEGNNTLTSKYQQKEMDTKTYAISKATGNEISNQFKEADINFYDEEFIYLSRSNWTGTWPTTYKDGQWEAPEDLLKNLEISFSEKEGIEKPVTGATNNLSVAMLTDTDLEDTVWQDLVEQMSVEEMDILVRNGGYATNQIKSIQLPATVDKDGTSGISNTLVGGKSGIGVPPEILLASTWNKEIAKEFGKAVGEDSLALGVQVWYAPACNIHRSPYSGRSFEYFSEDAHLSGTMAAAVVQGANEKGCITTVKHFAVNDQESNRIGGAMFLNEQSMREIYLAPFEIATREGGTLSYMASMNRIGARWTGGSYELMTETLRNEWGFQGFVVTDQASFDVFAYEDLREGLQAGTDLWLNSDASLWKLKDSEMTDTVVTNLQTASKRIAYSISRSNAMNGLAADGQVIKVMPLWQKGLVALDILVGIAVLLAIFFVTKSLLYKKNEIEIKNE